MNTLIKQIRRQLRRCIPENRRGDHFLAWSHFVRVHRRLPTDKLLFNDVLYRIKTTGEILEPLRALVSDKEFVKLYVKAQVGDQFNIPTIKVLYSCEEAATYAFPADCCIKPTHLSGKVIFRRQSSVIDFAELSSWFGLSIYPSTREANYRYLQRKVIVEPLIFDDDNLSDYKVFCYKGRPRLIGVDLDRYIGHKRMYVDCDWNELPFTITYPRSDRKVARPDNLDEMLTVASALSRHFSFIRVDMYSNGKECHVGELTNIPTNAGGIFIPASAEKLASDIIFGTTS